LLVGLVLEHCCQLVKTHPIPAQTACC
jgi:hypothetical protein